MSDPNESWTAKSARDERARKLAGDIPSPGAGGFHYLALPAYFPIIAVLLYPLATAAMIATDAVLGSLLSIANVGRDSIPLLQWIVPIGVFLIVWRIDQRLGQTQPYYFFRHLARLLVLGVLFNVILLTETGLATPEMKAGRAALLAGGLPSFRFIVITTQAMVTNGGQFASVLAMMVVSHFFLRAYIWRRGWDEALRFWRLRPRTYEPGFLANGESWLPRQLQFRRSDGRRQRKPDEFHRRIAEMLKTAATRQPAATSPAAQSTGKDALITTTCSLAREHFDSQVAMHKLVARAGGARTIRQLSVADLVRGFEQDPGAMDAWQSLSDTLGSSPGWFIDAEPGQHSWKVGQRFDGELMQFDDRAQAFAAYVRRYLVGTA